MHCVFLFLESSFEARAHIEWSCYGIVGTHVDNFRAFTVALNESDSLAVVGDCAQNEGENPILGLGMPRALVRSQ